MGTEEAILHEITRIQAEKGMNIGVLISERVHQVLQGELKAKGLRAEGCEQSPLRGIHYSIVPHLEEPGFRVGPQTEIVREAREILEQGQEDR